VIQEAVLFYELQPGFPNSFLIVYEELGHMNADGRKGDVEVTFLHQYPIGWRRRENSLDLFFTMPVQLENLANGWSTSLNCVNGKTFEVSRFIFNSVLILGWKVNIEGQSLIEILENGVSIVVPDYGLIDNAGSKGDLLIEISPSWENMTLPLWIELLQVCCPAPCSLNSFI
jgi:DnaJ-class molecular chaperone